MLLIAVIITVGAIVSFAYLTGPMIALRRINSSLVKIAKESRIKISANVSGLQRMREIHQSINNEKSLSLVTEAEKLMPIFILRFRVFLFFMILGFIVVLLLNKSAP